MSDAELSPDMIWFTCMECDRQFTLADMDERECPHCECEIFRFYNEELDNE